MHAVLYNSVNTGVVGVVGYNQWYSMSFSLVFFGFIKSAYIYYQLYCDCVQDMEIYPLKETISLEAEGRMGYGFLKGIYFHILNASTV